MTRQLAWGAFSRSFLVVTSIVATGIALAVVPALFVPGGADTTLGTTAAPSANLPLGNTPVGGLGNGIVFAQDAADLKLDDQARARVRNGLDFLAKRQNSDGSWTEKIGRKVHMEYRGTLGKHVGVTALAAIAFLSNGSMPGRGPYADNVENALDFILKHTEENGFITHQESRMYSHAFATLFLAEVYGMTGMEKVREKLKQSVNLIIGAQNDQGGWRYQPGAEDADMSITVCQVMALRAARNAGILVPKEVIDDAIGYVKLSFTARAGGTGAFLYQHESLPGGRVQRSRYTFALTAAGVTALFGAGEYDSDYITRGVGFLEQNRYTYHRAKNSFDYYYGMYYATQAMFQRGGREWSRWKVNVWKDLFRLQERNGSWMDLVGRNYATAMACIILQIPFQYLPIFER